MSVYLEPPSSFIEYCPVCRSEQLICYVWKRMICQHCDNIFVFRMGIDNKSGIELGPQLLDPKVTNA